MKTLRPILALVIIASFFTSCSTSNDVVGGVFQKRKYNKGFYWNKTMKQHSGQDSDVAKNKEEKTIRSSESTNPEVASLEPKKAVVKGGSTSQPVTGNIAVPSYNRGPEPGQKADRTAATGDSRKENGRSDAGVPNSTKTQLKEKKPLSGIFLKKQRSNDPSGDVALILLVILAILIPPLAVLLFEGATGRFVIVLVLWLLAVVGFFIIPFTGLLYLIAMIYALLIVLGVV